jgi:amino acid adenylation domain-containing protein
MTIFSLVNKFNAQGVSLWQKDGQLKFKAPKGVLTDDLREELIANKEDIIKFFQRISERKKYPPILPVSRTVTDGIPSESFPLSFAQERLWFIDQLNPDSAGYNVPKAVLIKGDLDIDHLEQTFNLIVARHENLRTIFPSQEGQAQQVILDDLDFTLEVIDLSHEPKYETRHEKARQLCQSEGAAFFDLAKGPLIRGKLIKLADQEHILILTMHHIISDAWSMGIMIKEFSLIMDCLRQGKQPNLKPLPIQYLDYSIWQRKLLGEGDLLEKQLAYWQNKLAGVEERLNLVTDYPRPSTPNFDGATEVFSLDAELTNDLNLLTEKHGSTFYMILMAAFKALLYRYTGQEDICFGGPIANRQHEDTDGLIGMFANTLVYRDKVEGEDSFISLLAKVKSTCLEAYENQDTPFEKIVDLVQPERAIGISPLFQVMFVLNNVAMELPEGDIQNYPLDTNFSRFDLVIHLRESPEGLGGMIVYKTALFKQQTIELMVKHFIALCQSIIAEPATKVCDLDFMSETEKRRLLVECNDNQLKYPKEKCIHQLFAEQVAINPDKVAVVGAVYPGDERGNEPNQLTFQQLYDQSRELALYIQKHGVKPDTLVGLCVERSPEMIVGILGILQAGSAYVPLDPDYPDDRLSYMLDDSRVTIVMTQNRFKDKVKALVDKDTQVIVLDDDGCLSKDDTADLKRDEIKLIEEVKSDNLAYVIYTSGSTGKPKGVMIEHKMVVDYCYSVLEKMDLHLCETFASVSTFSSDLGNIALYIPMMFSKTLYMFSDRYVNDPIELHNYMDKHPIDCMKITPSHFDMFKISDTKIVTVSKVLIFAGEPLTKQIVNLVNTLNPTCKVFNNYGPTETTISKISSSELNRSNTINTPSIYLGKPLNNTQIYILDQNNKPQPIGVPGELHIAGDGVARGYLNHPELTKEKFIPNPFQPNASLMYKSGDLARWVDNGKGHPGDIEYLGRIDTQVKIRGFRIETAEIETVLNQHPEIKSNAVVVQSQEGSGGGLNKQLIAFYVTNASQKMLASDDLKEHLLQTLPEYMLPVSFVNLDAMPLMSNGKVDRRTLEQMNVSLTSGQVYLAPTNDMEEKLVVVWSEILQMEAKNIGINDDFFSLGGHSLLAVMLVSKIKKELEISLPLQVLFNLKTISGTAEFMIAAQNQLEEFTEEDLADENETVEGTL